MIGLAAISRRTDASCDENVEYRLQNSPTYPHIDDLKLMWAKPLTGQLARDKILNHTDCFISFRTGETNETVGHVRK